MLEFGTPMRAFLAFFGLGAKGRVNIRMKGNSMAGPYQVYVERTIRSYGLRGWMIHQRLSIYETMEIELEGQRYYVEQLFEALKLGPPHAKILSAEAQWKTYRGDLRSFRVRV